SLRWKPWVSAPYGSVDEIQEGEEEDPDEVDEMPVQGDEVDRPEVLRVEVACHRTPEQPQVGDDATDDVDAVQARHHEVDAEEDVQASIGLGASEGVLHRLGARCELGAPEQPVVELVAVLEVLDHQKGAGAGDRDQDREDEALLVVELSAADAPGCGEAREEQHDRVDRAHRLVEEMVSLDEDLRVHAPVDRIGAEQATEEQELLAEKQPDPRLASVELVAVVLEMVAQELVVMLVVPVVGAVSVDCRVTHEGSR